MPPAYLGAPQTSQLSLLRRPRPIRNRRSSVLKPSKTRQKSADGQRRAVDLRHSACPWYRLSLHCKRWRKGPKCAVDRMTHEVQRERMVVAGLSRGKREYSRFFTLVFPDSLLCCALKLSLMF